MPQRCRCVEMRFTEIGGVTEPGEHRSDRRVHPGVVGHQRTRPLVVGERWLERAQGLMH